MGKSRRKVPIIRQEKENHKYLNRQIRRDKYAEIPYGSAFKRHRIHAHDWHYIYTWEEAKRKYYESKRLQEEYTLEEYYLEWMKWTTRK